MNLRRLKERNSQFLLDDIRSKNTVFRGLPEIVNFNHTDVCNLRCIMCFQAYTPGSRTLPPDRVQNVLDQVLPTAHKLKLTTAGEPVIGNFADIVDIARAYRCRLELITNATRLTPERFALMEDLLDQIVISLDSHEKETLDRIRGNGVHARIMKNLEAIGASMANKEKRFISAYHLVLMTSNVRELKGFVQFAKETNIDLIKVLRLHYMTEELKRDEDPLVNFSPEELSTHIGAAQDEARRLGVNLILEEVGFVNVECTHVRNTVPAPVQTFACNMLMQEVYINPDETVYPCCVPADLKMGSLRNHKFIEIWNGRRYQQLRRQMFTQRLLGPCANCKMYSLTPDDGAFNYLPGSEALQIPEEESWAKKALKRLTRALLLGIFLAGSVSCARDSSPRVRLALITLDTLRYDSLIENGRRASTMPQTRKWIEKGVLFENFYVSMPMTLPSHASFFTGLHPWQHGVSRNGQVLPQELKTLAEEFKEAGFFTAAVVASAPLHNIFGIAQGFDVFEDEFTENPDARSIVAGRPLPGKNFYSKAHHITERALALLDDTVATKQFFWFHYFDPHAPYGDSQADEDSMNERHLLRLAKTQPGMEEIDETIEEMRRLYDADVAYLDQCLDRLLTRLFEDPNQETHVLVVSDHGEVLGEGYGLGHAKFLIPETLHVPMFILSPELKPSRRTDVASCVDVFPTLLALGGISTEPQSGRDLSHPSGAPSMALGMRRTFDRPHQNHRLDGRKEILKDNQFFLFQAGRLWVGNGDNLSIEHSTLTPAEEEIAAGVKHLFHSLEQQMSGVSVEEITNPEVRRALEALGYTEEPANPDTKR